MRAKGDLKLTMWLVLAVFIVTLKVQAKTHSSHLDELDQLDDLDYSHNIFIPLNAYENYELFMEFARGSELGKRSGDIVALPEISALPASGTKTYLVPGVNCQVKLKDKTIDGSSKRVIERSTCAEGWTIKAALARFFGDVGQNLEMETAGLVHNEQLKFKMLVFESTGYTLYGDATGETYMHMQSKLSLSGVNFEFKLPTAYSFEAAGIKLTGTHSVTENNQNKNIAVSFEKAKGSSVFAVKLTIPQMMLGTFASIFMTSSEFTESGIADSKYGLTFDPVKQIPVQSSSGDKVIGIFNPSNGNFQLTGKFSSNNQNAFSGQNTDIFLTVDRESLGASVSFNLLFGFPHTFAVRQAVSAFVPNNADVFNDRMLNNIIRKWYLSFTSKSFTIPTERADYTQLFSAAFPGDTTKKFKKGLGLMLPVNLYETLSSCQGGNSGLSNALKDTYMTGVLIDKGLKFKYPAGLTVPLAATVKCQAAESETVKIPDPLEQIEQVTGLKLEELAFDTGTGEVKITLLYDRNIVIYENILEINKPTLEIAREGSGEPWSFTLSADVTIFGIDASCSVSYSDKTITAEVSAEVIPLTNFLSAFSFGIPLPFTFEIHSFKLQVEISTESGGDKKLAVSGKPVFNGFDKVTVEAAVWTGETTGVALAVVLDRVRLDEVLEQILGISDIPMAWFSEMTLILAVSNQRATGCDNPVADESICEDAEGGSEDSDSSSDDSSSNDNNSRNKSERKMSTKKANQKSSKKVSRNTKRRLSKRGNNQNARSNIKQGDEMENQISKNLRRMVMEKAGSKRFELEHLGSIDLQKGLYIKASFFLPSDCKNDALCEWMKQKLGTNAELYIEGLFNTKGFTLTAGIKVNLKLADALYLTEASLKLTFTTQERSVSLRCALKYDNPGLNPEPLIFYGALTVSFTGELEVSMIMKGLIYEPFGIPKLAFGDMIIAIGITVSGGLPSFQIGAKIKLGKVRAGTEEGQFVFAGYFGFNPADPTDNYVYAKRSGDPLTIGNFIKNFEIGDITLPPPIADSGFYGETIFSFSAQGKVIEELDLEIQAGFYFKGTLRILEVEVFAEININTAPESLRIFANISMTPISWVGGLLRISRASDDDKNGPFLVVDIGLQKIEVDIAGFAYCLGISAEIRVIINSTHFYFHIEGDMFTVFRANLTVAAVYGGTLADMEYDFNGCASFDLRRIAEYVYQAIKNAQQAISAAFNKARAKVERARAAVNRAFDKVNQWKGSIESYKARLRRRSAELERKRRELNYSCRDRCGKVCIGFLDWNSRCWRIWGRWVGCPKWNPCKWRVDDIICIAGCELKRAWNKFVTWAEQVGIQIMLGLSEIAQALLSGVELFRGIANGVLDLANGFLSAAEAFTNGILSAVNGIVQGLASSIVVEYFCVHGNLKPVESVCVGCKAKMRLLGRPIQWNAELCIDLSFFGAIGQRTAVTHTPDISKIDSKVQEFESEGNKVDQEVEDMQREEAKQNSEVNSKTSGDVDTNFRAKRSHVPTEEEAYFYRLAYDRIPDVNIRSFETEKSMKEGAPWFLAESWSPTKRTLETDESVPQKRVLRIDEKDHCKLLENVHSNYNNIADGFGTFLKNAEKQKAGFNAMKRSYLSGIHYVKDVFDEGDQRHNITDEEREHVKYWYDYVDNGISQHIQKTEGLFKAQRKTYIPDFRKQVNQLITRETRSTLPEFVTKMKDAVLKAYEKRSEIPKPTVDRQSKKWETLHETFQEISSNEEASYEELAKHVATATRLLADVKRSEIPCAA